MDYHDLERNFIPNLRELDINWPEYDTMENYAKAIRHELRYYSTFKTTESRVEVANIVLNNFKLEKLTELLEEAEIYVPKDLKWKGLSLFVADKKKILEEEFDDLGASGDVKINELGIAKVDSVLIATAIYSIYGPQEPH